MTGAEKEMILVLDIGTSFLKCGCIDSENNIITRNERVFPMSHHQTTYETDFNVFFNTVVDLLNECMAHTLVRQSGVKALLITSQAQTFVPVDEGFSPLRSGIVWLDERAGKEATWIMEHLPDFAGKAGLHTALSGLYASKLLWLKRNEPSLFNGAGAFPLIQVISEC
ncbi:MAG: FGGY family carbohydrate kinase [Bacteroidota bacterium]